MSRRTWSRLKSDAAVRLVAACPWLATRPTELAALTAIVAFAEVRLYAVAREGELEARVRTVPAIGKDRLAHELVSLVEELATSYATGPRSPSYPAFGSWIEAHGFSAMSVALLSSNAEWQGLTAAATIAARATKTLAEQSRALALNHMSNILARDLPHALFLRHGLTAVAAWLLAPETSGQASRARILLHRLQAMTLFGALSGTLLEDTVTKAIDDGEPLAPLLAERHDLAPAELRALREARQIVHAIETPTDFHVAVEELKAHEVPLEDWPGGGKPAQAHAWQRSVWTTGQRQHLIRPDYLGNDGDGAKDALGALREDLLRPLFAERARLGGYKLDGRVYRFAYSVELEGAKGGGDARRLLLAALRNAIVGPRGIKAFHEAVGLWHRRVASLSALRHERRAEQPGWPALCAPWRSDCGRFEIAVLALAADLVVEGRALDHCVGGYYEICRRGDTQILSLRQDGKRVSTVELKLGSDLSAITIEVGQFKGHRNATPPAELHDPLRSFLRAVRSGAHPVNASRLAAYRKKMRDTWDGSWRNQDLSISHAREVFSFYLPLLPRNTPAGFDAWCEASGLNAAIDAALAHLRA